MSYPSYGPAQNYSPLDGYERAIYASPESYSQPFQQIDDHGDLGAGIEMLEGRPALPPRPHQQLHYQSSSTVYSTSSTLFPSVSSDSQPFLHDPINKIDSFYAANVFVPLKDNTGKQFRHILQGSLTRWLLTAGMCAAYIISTIIWQTKGAQDETQKKLYNTITTAISIALGLNIASSFKDMALNMRWLILSARKRNLVEVDLILNADSLSKLCKLVFVTKRPTVIACCIGWLLLNLAAQAGLAMLSLTYGFNVDTNHVIMAPGNVSIPDLGHFYPLGMYQTNLSPTDEKYMAHLWGQLAEYYGIGDLNNVTTDLPVPVAGQIYRDNWSLLWYDFSTSHFMFRFIDSPSNVQAISQYSIYSGRTINVTWSCSSTQLEDLSKDTGTKSIDVPGSGNITIPDITFNATTFFTTADSQCGSRCSMVEALEVTASSTWYYNCNITMTKSQNDTDGYSNVSDAMALIATSSIAQSGYNDSSGISAQVYPVDTPFGSPVFGDAKSQGWGIAMHGLGSIAGASIYNPFISYVGVAPSQGQSLEVGHPYSFYVILGLICGVHLFFCIVVALYSNRVMVGPDGHLSMSILLRPIADALDGISGGKENKAFREAKRQTQVRYEKSRNGRWILNMLPK